MFPKNIIYPTAFTQCLNLVINKLKIKILQGKLPAWDSPTYMNGLHAKIQIQTRKINKPSRWHVALWVICEKTDLQTAFGKKDLLQAKETLTNYCWYAKTAGSFV